MIELDPSSVSRIPIRLGASGKVFRENSYYKCLNPSFDPFYNPESDNKTPFKVQNFLFCSLKDFEGHANGVF